MHYLFFGPGLAVAGRVGGLADVLDLDDVAPRVGPAAVELARIYGFTDLDGSRPDAWRYLTEVQDAGRPADTTGYR